jgi:aminopeptidase YwaD
MKDNFQILSLYNNQKKLWLKTALISVLLWFPTACAVRTKSVGEVILSPSVAQTTNSNRTLADIEALVNLGPRVTGTPVMEKASTYLVNEYRKAGYVTEVQTFTYSKFRDNGSHITINGETIKGTALNGTISGNFNAPLVVVPNYGRKADFASANVAGSIAIVQRGEIRFSEKAKNALASRAIGLIIVNNKSEDLYGSLAEEVKIPVLAISKEKGDRVLQQVQRVAQNVSLKIDAQKRNVTGRNIIAHLEGVTQPKILLGAHYDSVVGSPGANDNASGTAVLLSLARNLSKTQTARQAWFVAFDGEEDGLQGSRAFVKTAKPEFLSGLKAMMNFDMVGVNKELGIGGSSSLTKFVRNIKPEAKIFGSIDGSDHAAFAAKKVPILFFYRGQEPNYHTPNDKKVDAKLLDETTQVGLDIIPQILNEKTSN